jgi:hypothetical protein
MNDLHNKYLDHETIYAAKVDSVITRSGHNRIGLTVELRSQRVETVRVFWNDYADSTDIAVGNATGMFNCMLNNMEENSYIFQLVSIDKFGNRSLPFEATGIVYGSRFQEQLSNRGLFSFSADDSGLTVKWSGNPDNAVYSQLKYVDVHNSENIRKIPTDETTTVVTDWQSEMHYRTAFLPETDAIDTFYTAWRTVEHIPYKYPTAGWTAESRNGNHGWGAAGGQPDKVLDGNLETGWHSNPGAPLPQCLVIDMQTSKTIDYLLMRFQANAVANNWIYIKNIELYLTDTPAIAEEYQSFWGSPVASYLRPSGVDLIDIRLPSGSSGKYLILYFPDSTTNTYISFTELEVYR